MQSFSVFHNILPEFIVPEEAFTDMCLTLGKRNKFTFISLNYLDCSVCRSKPVRIKFCYPEFGKAAF